MPMQCRDDFTQPWQRPTSEHRRLVRPCSMRIASNALQDTTAGFVSYQAIVLPTLHAVYYTGCALMPARSDHGPHTTPGAWTLQASACSTLVPSATIPAPPLSVRCPLWPLHTSSARCCC